MPTMWTGRGRDALWPLLLISLIAFYSSAVGYNLANYFPVRGDEVLTMSASHKLASTGVLGSDLATGLSDADRRFFLNLPVQNLLQAPVFAIAGTGIWQARLPSLAAGIAVITLTAWFTRRAFGPLAAAITSVALVFWRSNLIGTEPRPPLVALGHSGRYDLLVVAFLWATIVLLHACLLRPRRITATLAGVSAALATLTQFYGIAAVILIAVAYIMRWGRAVWREAVPRWSVLGCLLVLLPYGVFVALDADAFLAQAALHGPRVQFFEPQFWLRNLLNESARYASLTEPSILGIGGAWALGPWMIFIGAAPGIVPLIVSSRGSGAVRALPWLSLAVPFAVLALVEQTKAVLYASLIVPSLCVCLGCGLDAMIRRRPFDRGSIVGRVLSVVSVALLIVLIVEGFRGYQFSLRESRHVSPYLGVGRQIASFMPDEGAVLGPWRWWWALGDRRYMGVNGFWWQSQRVSDRGDASLRDEVAAKNVKYLIVDRDFQGDLNRTVPSYRQDASEFIDKCSSVAGVVDDATYGRIEVRRVSCAAWPSTHVAK